MKKLLGFTLAEVMIVVLIIGVVAMFMLPILLQEVSMRVNSNRQANIAQKITKSVETMIVSGDYENISNTEEFVDKLSRYLKIVKRCNSSNIQECWPTRQVKTPNGNKYEVKNAKKGTDIHVNSTEDNVGIVLVDGASLILSYNPNAPTPTAEGGFTTSTKSLPIGKNKYKDFAYTSSATGAIDFVMDVNGGTGPNQEPSDNGEYYDIRPFKIALFSKPECSGFKVNGVCVVDLGTSYEAINCSDSSVSYCQPVNTNVTIDFWAGGRKACADIGMKMPTVEEAKALISIEPENMSKFYGYITSSIYSNYAVGTVCDASWCMSAPFARSRTDQGKVFCISKS